MNFIVAVILMVGMSNLDNDKHMIEGDWVLVEIQIEKSKSHPGFNLLNFRGSNVSLYVDPGLDDEVNLTLDGSTLYYNEKKFADIESIDDSQLLLLTTVETGKGSVESVFKYVRLETTILNVDLNNISNAEYEIQTDGKRSIISLGDEKSMNGFGNGASKDTVYQYGLKKVKSTIFLSAYLNSTLQSMIPIRKISSEYMTLYAIPNGPVEATAFRVED